MTTDVVSLEGSQRLDHLEDSMQALRFRHMPVVDGRKLIGLVSERDLLRVRASSLLPHKRQQDHFIAEHFCVADVMTRDVVTVSPDAPLADVAALMRKRRLGCVPVVEPDGTLAGIITEADFVQLGQSFLPRS
jgi:CBS domain-containing protein